MIEKRAMSSVAVAANPRCRNCGVWAVSEPKNRPTGNKTCVNKLMLYEFGLCINVARTLLTFRSPLSLMNIHLYISHPHWSAHCVGANCRAGVALVRQLAQKLNHGVL